MSPWVSPPCSGLHPVWLLAMTMGSREASKGAWDMLDFAGWATCQQVQLLCGT